MEYITLRMLLNIMPAEDLVRTSIRLESNNEFENRDIVKVDELREEDNPLLDYAVALFYPTTDIQIYETDNEHLKLNDILYTMIVLRKREF